MNILRTANFSRGRLFACSGYAWPVYFNVVAFNLCSTGMCNICNCHPVDFLSGGFFNLSGFRPGKKHALVIGAGMIKNVYMLIY
jgi:hypothetical protein